MKNGTALILIILGLGLLYVFTMPQYSEVKMRLATQQEYKELLDNISDIAETRDRLLVDYEKIPRTELDRLSKILPENVDTVRLAQEVDTIAARYGIAVESIQVEKDSPKNSAGIVLPEYAKSYERATVSFNFVSSYQNFRRFLEDLERSLRIMNVQSLSFSSGGEANIYEHKISIETYWLK